MATVTNFYITTFTAVAYGTPQRLSVNQTFANIRSGAGTALQAFLGVGLTGSATTNQFSGLSRGIASFDTSSIPDNAVITSATLSAVATSGFTKSSGLGTDSIELCSATPASSTIVSSSDFPNVGTTSFGSISYASFTDGVANTYTLNASGLAAINLTGYTSFGFRLGWDLSGTFGGAWSSGATTQLIIGGAQFPTLTVNYTIDFPSLSVNNISSLDNVTTITTS